jgi:hypothetical protein
MGFLTTLNQDVEIMIRPHANSEEAGWAAAGQSAVGKDLTNIARTVQNPHHLNAGR